MKTMRFKKALSYILCMVLIAAVALFATGCGDRKSASEAPVTSVNIPVEDGSTVGKGETQFTFSVTDREGKETRMEILTDRKTVGDALLELGLIAGDNGQYGLYVKTVNGVTADYDKDGVYWAFYVNGEYASSGVDTTDIVAGNTYAFKVE